LRAFIPIRKSRTAGAINLVECENCAAAFPLHSHAHVADFHYKILRSAVEKGGQTTVAKEFAIYFKIKVSKSMTNSVRYVFAHCSRPIPFVHPPTHAKTPLDPETYDGAPLIYLHTTAQQTQRK